MTIFNHLFTELFRSKARRAHSLLLIQFVGALAIVVISGLSSGSFRVYIEGHYTNSFFPELLTIFASLSLAFVPVFYLITCFANERTSRNQTYRLVPINDGLFYVDNILSSFIAVVYYGILNVLSIGGLFCAAYFTDADFHRLMGQDLRNIQIALRRADFSKDLAIRLVELLLLLVLISLLAYLLISFLGISSNAIVDFLPNVSSQAALRTVRLVVIILIAWLLVKGNDFLHHLAASPFDYLMGNYDNSRLGFGLGLMLALDLVFLAANMFLMSRFCESRTQN